MSNWAETSFPKIVERHRSVTSASELASFDGSPSHPPLVWLYELQGIYDWIHSSGVGGDQALLKVRTVKRDQDLLSKFVLGILERCGQQ